MPILILTRAFVHVGRREDKVLHVYAGRGPARICRDRHIYFALDIAIGERAVWRGAHSADGAVAPRGRGSGCVDVRAAPTRRVRRRRTARYIVILRDDVTKGRPTHILKVFLDAT